VTGGRKLAANIEAEQAAHRSAAVYHSEKSVKKGARRVGRTPRFAELPVASDAHDAPAGHIPSPVTETDALDDTNAMPVPVTVIDVGVTPALMAPTMIGSAMVTIAVPIAVAVPDLNRQIRARGGATIGGRGQGSGETGARGHQRRKKQGTREMHDYLHSR